MKTTVRRLKLTHYELRVLIEALNAKRLKKRANGIDNTADSNLIFRFIGKILPKKAFYLEKRILL